MSSPLPLVFLHLLADRQLNPGAVLVSFTPQASDALLELAESENFASFAKRFPCLIPPQQMAKLPLAGLKSLQTAGCQLLDNGTLQQIDAPEKPVFLEQVLWLTGNWYFAPPAKPVGAQAASRTLALKLVQLTSSDADTHEIEEVFRQDPTLSYHLLRLVNSLSMGTSRTITSFSQAILILGRQQLKRWLNLMLFAARKDDPRAAMLLARVAVRARSMELLAKQVGLDRATQELSFMAGMFSLLGVLFGMPLTEVFKPLQMSEALVDAVLDRKGEIGQLLQLVECIEKADAQAVEPLLSQLNISAPALNLLNLEAYQWMLGITRDAQGASHA